MKNNKNKCTLVYNHLQYGAVISAPIYYYLRNSELCTKCYDFNMAVKFYL